MFEAKENSFELPFSPDVNHFITLVCLIFWKIKLDKNEKRV